MLSYNSPLEGDRLNMLSGRTPLRRHSTYGFRVAKSPSSLMSFCSPSYFPANDCSFACVSFHIPVLPFPPALPIVRTSSPKIPLQFPSLAYFLSRPSTLPSHVLRFSPAFPYIPYFPLFLYFPCLSRISLPKILLSMPAPGSSSSVSVPPSLFLYPSLPYFLVLWILPQLCL